ncbi:hypothetical protein NC651_007221 [Populus alba x Populus x berolinensis]|nr:hypothetical protein NC651_007221 [Populus alba x Populus x berolinensis]
MRHHKYFIVHCLLYKVTFKGYNIVHNLATTNLKISIGCLSAYSLLQNAILGRKRKMQEQQLDIWITETSFTFTRTSKHQVKSTEEDLSIVIERHANQVRNQETRTNIQKSTQLDRKKQSYRIKKQEGLYAQKLVKFQEVTMSHSINQSKM